MLCLLVIGLVLAWAGYSAGLLTGIWPQIAMLLLVVGYPACYALGVLTVRAGISNPWIKKFERWRSRAEDRRLDARQARADLAQAEAQIAQLKSELDEVICHFTGQEDPAIARRAFLEGLEQPKVTALRGRRRHSATGRSDEKRREIAREIRTLRDQGLTWDQAAGRYGISADTGRRWIGWLEEEERTGIA